MHLRRQHGPQDLLTAIPTDAAAQEISIGCRQFPYQETRFVRTRPVT